MADSCDELTSSYRHPWVWLQRWYTTIPIYSRTPTLFPPSDGFNHRQCGYRDIFSHSARDIANVSAKSTYSQSLRFFPSRHVDWRYELVSLAYCELYLTAAAVFAPGRFHCELFETDDTDVEIVHEFLNVDFRQDSKGIRVPVNWDNLIWWILLPNGFAVNVGLCSRACRERCALILLILGALLQSCWCSQTSLAECLRNVHGVEYP